MKKQKLISFALSTFACACVLSSAVFQTAAAGQEEINSLTMSVFVPGGNHDHKINASDILKTAAERSSDSYAVIPGKQTERGTNGGVPFGNINGVPGGLISQVNCGGENVIVIAFHGTANKDDALTDANAFFKEKWEFLDGHSAHPGFLKRYLALRASIYHWLMVNGYNYTNMPKILITGHSMGGALAILCAIEFEQQFPGKVILANFCSPRALSKKSKKFGDTILPEGSGRNFRTWRNQDAVASVAPGWLGYQHFGRSIMLDKAPDQGSGFSAYHSMKQIEKDIKSLINGNLNFNEVVKKDTVGATRNKYFQKLIFWR